MTLKIELERSNESVERNEEMESRLEQTKPAEVLASYLKGLGRRISTLRKERSMSQQQLADTADLDRTYISAVEHGKQNVTVGAIVKLAVALQIPLDDLMVGGQ